jgi:hypothetical protein
MIDETIFLFRTLTLIIKCVKVRALFEKKNKVRFARAEQLCTK